VQRRKDAKKKRRRGIGDRGWQRIALKIAGRIQVGRLGVKERF
jgi:hypothetical protein